MALTPEDVLNKTFTQTQSRRGYDEREVDDFLDDIVAEMRRMTKDSDDLRGELSACSRGIGVAPVPARQGADTSPPPTSTTCGPRTPPSPRASPSPRAPAATCPRPVWVSSRARAGTPRFATPSCRVSSPSSSTVAPSSRPRPRGCRSAGAQIAPGARGRQPPPSPGGGARHRARDPGGRARGSARGEPRRAQRPCRQGRSRTRHRPVRTAAGAEKDEQIAAPPRPSGPGRAGRPGPHRPGDRACRGR